MLEKFMVDGPLCEALPRPEGAYFVSGGLPTSLDPCELECPYCREALTEVTIAARWPVHRVTRIVDATGPRWLAEGELIPTATHRLVGCLTCQVGFTFPRAGLQGFNDDKERD